MPESGIVGAVGWVEALLLGSIGTGVAILAIAGVGFLMMSGRLPARRGVTAIVGCFILFGASAIANGLVGGAANGEEAPPPAVEQAYIPAKPAPTSNDPYAGASVPDQRTKDIFQ